MKIIQALKQIKDLNIKAEDLRKKISEHCAALDCDTPVYPDQRATVNGWLQSHSDIMKEIATLRFRIQKTNINTSVTIRLGTTDVTKTINEWISRRRDLANYEYLAWRSLTTKNLQPEYKNRLTNNSPEQIIKRVLYFDPTERDNKIELYRSEPTIIDGTLETINAITDLVE